VFAKPGFDHSDEQLGSGPEPCKSKVIELFLQIASAGKKYCAKLHFLSVTRLWRVGSGADEPKTVGGWPDMAVLWNTRQKPPEYFAAPEQTVHTEAAGCKPSFIRKTIRNELSLTPSHQNGIICPGQNL